MRSMPYDTSVSMCNNKSCGEVACAMVLIEEADELMIRAQRFQVLLSPRRPFHGMPKELYAPRAVSPPTHGWLDVQDVLMVSFTSFAKYYDVRIDPAKNGLRDWTSCATESAHSSARK
jgi:hypothetical protein